MHVSYTRSGGVAGLLRRPLEIDTEKLSTDKARELRELIEEAHFFDQPARQEAGAPAAAARDTFEYEIVVEEGGRTHTVHTSDVALTGELRPLIKWLQREDQERLKARRAERVEPGS